MLLKARQLEITFPRPAMVMGILNVTPDSFSDGGKFADPERAVQRGLEMVAQGADIIDVGGESTRPRAHPVPLEEELRRVLPVVSALCTRTHVPISVDTMKPWVAEAALDAGASIVNDVAANREDSGMWRVIAATGAGYICTHMRGTPATMQASPSYTNVVAEVGAFFEDRLKHMADCGVTAQQVILDPGIGFGKGLEHNLSILANVGAYRRFDRPIMLGVSRKSFIEKIAGKPTKARLAGSLACECLAVEAGVQMLRVHDVEETVQAVRTTEAILKQRRAV